MSALQSGISGMLAHQARLDAVGNNIANANTFGYKSERVLFADSFYNLLRGATAPTEALGGGNPSAIGSGVVLAGSDVNFSQGALTATGRTLDLAIQGNGFIAVTDGSNIYYTRNGALGVDADGNLIQLSSGLRVVALPPGDTDNPSISPTSTIKMPLDQSSVARATTSLDLAGNLDSGIAVDGSYSLDTQVFDSLGAAHKITLTFTHSATPGEWAVTGTSADGTVTIGSPATVTFDADGKPTVDSLSMDFALTTPAGASPSYTIGVGIDKVTQLAQESSAALRSQDGLPPGTLSGISFGTDGAIVGSYSNGFRGPLGQLVTATFANASGLEPAGNSLYAASINSGLPNYGAPTSSGRGAILSGQLEASNVDLTREFAEMIATQRGFQASSRVVNTADQVLQEVMNIIR